MKAIIKNKRSENTNISKFSTKYVSKNTYSPTCFEAESNISQGKYYKSLRNKSLEIREKRIVELKEV